MSGARTLTPVAIPAPHWVREIYIMQGECVQGRADNVAGGGRTRKIMTGNTSELERIQMRQQ